MPKRLIKKIKGLLSGNTETPIARVIPRGEHDFPEEDIRRSVLTVLDGLTDAGYEAYLVGGSIRDGLIGLHPKDFDIATSATPEQIKAVFPRNCRLIGRRFRLAHVRFGREILEVATFRGCHSKSETNENHSSQSEEGMLLRDNVFGTLDEDAVRRDFTANALYYRHTDGAVLDYVDGYEDILHRTLRLIGDPEQRYREDPVRMLRAVRFAAKLDFDIEPKTAAPIRELSDLLGLIPAARLFEEVLKLFLGGYAQAVWPLLVEYELARWLFPQSVPEVNNEPGMQAMIDLALRNTDHRLAQGKPVTPAFLLAVLLWGPLQMAWKKEQEKGTHATPALQKAIQKVISEQTQSTSIPKRFGIPMREIWELQGRLAQRSLKRCESLVQHPRFRAAYDMLLLREEAGEIEPGLGQWWTQYQEADAEERANLCQSLGGSNKPRRRRRYKNRRRSTPPNP
ncbi:MAG: poly(A) polymerase [Pseudomonadales bacterium]|jgi:poly(A) polymerase|uniref:polynucleotide adenylyltransferase PcnB n=1 Tax=unclassified Ketobacter TaxID=2639109 RepID=UPI000C69DAC8|nr:MULTISPECIES: polynucleotide adenylyltransferase PcnB [unclassified Ketobacter]MAQ24336.1 poly(A) polymerase [Pseudomonadales bacterium]MEC8813732.1 polynucleotide adenylyltransferase PcnB [Pseudomonadota bacterium]TNC88283.1 MAG: poly(A) polymerase [Alcanivorax sp.]HAU13380.1 polynucleotide adenylyltransferase PcnB [Gammaproteobacteria bacterium]MBI25558.1 poly(A) polymerase [Pseudomonadales bacterium]|tara:strand:+ start:7564 stop:8925 length:1362 start_codon:yes stop_codon:yes gene_type:complete